MCTSNAPLPKGTGLFIKCALSSATIEEQGLKPRIIYLEAGLKTASEGICPPD